jgi:hypothetical protein
MILIISFRRYISYHFIQIGKADNFAIFTPHRMDKKKEIFGEKDIHYRRSLGINFERFRINLKKRIQNVWWEKNLLLSNDISYNNYSACYRKISDK